LENGTTLCWRLATKCVTCDFQQNKFGQQFGLCNSPKTKQTKAKQKKKKYTSQKKIAIEPTVNISIV